MHLHLEGWRVWPSAVGKATGSSAACSPLKGKRVVVQAAGSGGKSAAAAQGHAGDQALLRPGRLLGCRHTLHDGLHAGRSQGLPGALEVPALLSLTSRHQAHFAAGEPCKINGCFT